MQEELQIKLGWAADIDLAPLSEGAADRRHVSKIHRIEYVQLLDISLPREVSTSVFVWLDENSLPVSPGATNLLQKTCLPIIT